MSALHKILPISVVSPHKRGSLWKNKRYTRMRAGRLSKTTNNRLACIRARYSKKILLLLYLDGSLFEPGMASLLFSLLLPDQLATGDVHSPCFSALGYGHAKRNEPQHLVRGTRECVTATVFDVSHDVSLSGSTTPDRPQFTLPQARRRNTGIALLPCIPGAPIRMRRHSARLLLMFLKPDMSRSRSGISFLSFGGTKKHIIKTNAAPLFLRRVS